MPAALAGGLAARRVFLPRFTCIAPLPLADRKGRFSAAISRGERKTKVPPAVWNRASSYGCYQKNLSIYSARTLDLVRQTL